MKIKNSLKLELNNSIKVKKSLLELNDKIEIVIDKISNSLEKKGKIFFCGNGGSAADAQHLAAELLIRLRSKINK